MKEILFESVDSKNIMMSANTFHTLKNNLVNNMGSHKTKGFLFRFGKEFGIDAARNNLKNNNLNKKVGTRHSRLGHVKDVIFNGEIIRHEDGSIECVDTRGRWIESFEAELHLKNHGVGDECTCHMLCGFASGALSYEFGVSIIALETTCIAKGDANCEFEVKLEKDWSEEHTELINLYQNDNILSELEMTYDSLLHHKLMLEKMSVFHSELTRKVTDKHTMHEIIQAAFDLINKPILIEDLHGNILSQVGLDEEQIELIKTEKTFVNPVGNHQSIITYRSENYEKITSTVVINSRNYATCSFVYFDSEKIDANDYLFLERISTVIALCILYEEVQFEEQERMKSSLLERLIHNKNLKNIESYYKFLPFKVEPPFSTGIITVQNKRGSKEIIDIHDQLIQISRESNELELSCIFAIIGEDIALLTSQADDKVSFKKKMNKVFKKVQKNNSKYSYSLGLSGDFLVLTDFEQSLKEARISQRFPNRKTITDYEDLGILGDIVTSMSQEKLQEMAKKTLKDLYDFEDPRKKELLYTLYVYLINGQRLKETMDELSLSIGGIQYRIKQIEELLNISLKNASTVSYTLLVIQALILSDDLVFD